MPDTSSNPSASSAVLPDTIRCIAHSPERAATVSGRSRSRIFKAIKEKELSARKDGKATLIDDDELRRWIATFPVIDRQSIAT